MKKWAIIGGSGFKYHDAMIIQSKAFVETEFGQTSAPLVHALYQGKEIVFLARHGEKHTIPPHKINYRANISALKQAGVTHIISMAAVGGITSAMGPKVLAIPNQIIDYTWGREQTFFSDDLEQVTHIDFSYPYCEDLRQDLIQQAKEMLIDLVNEGTYAATQGPRLESAAEIKRLQQDGCDLVGMTGMPEAALARELDLCYAHCCIVANWAAGKADGLISMVEIEENLASSIHQAETLILATVTKKAF